MKVLVTGATGLVGGHVVDRLLERGDDVTALVRSPTRAAPLAARGVRLVTGDLSNSAAIGAAVGGQDIVHHIAATLGASTEAEFMEANREGTRRIAQACAAAATPPRLVLVSSMAAGGPSRRGAPKTAAGDDHPVTMYGRSKLAAEQVLPPLAIPWTVLRPPTVYGPRERENLLPFFKAVRLGLGPMLGDGSMELSLIHVADLADAIVTAGSRPEVVGKVFYVNHPEVVTAADVLRAIAREMHRNVLPLPIPRWAVRAALTCTGAWADFFHQRSILHPDKVHELFQEAWTADPAPFLAATGWQPRYDLAAGLADTAAWYRREGWI
jgi:dihydroflavonol-4-reductase